MTKIFLDSNIFLRAFLQDNDQSSSVKQLLEVIEEGRFSPYTSSIVLIEISFVLSRTYKKTREEIIDYLESILETRNITILEETDSPLALMYYKKSGIKFSDCLIASQVSQEMILITFDRDFSKIKGFTTKTPAEILVTES